jgi:DNA-binding SARP family transcriptional activator
MLHSVDGNELLKADSTSIWLAPQSMLWVDVDAFDLLVAQSRATSDTETPGDFWLHAHELLRGEFLADEPARNWLTASWVRQRRNDLRAARRQLIHHLSEHLLQHGQQMQAEALLQTHINRFPTDQDALEQLLRLLLAQNRKVEARESYARCKAALAAVDKQPAAHLRTLLEQTAPLQTQTVSPLPSVSSLPSVVQLQRTQQAAVTESTRDDQRRLLLPPPEVSISNALFAQIDTSSTSVDIATWFGARVNNLKALGASWNESNFTWQQQQTSIHFEIEKWNIMTDQDNRPTNEYRLTRRMALATLATLPTALLTKVQYGPVSSLLVEEFLRESATSITACYHLLKRDGLTTVAYTLPQYLPLLISLTQTSSHYQQTAASLASQGCFLMGLVKLHQLQFDSQVAYCKKSVEFAKIANNRISLAAALTHLGDAYFDSGQPEQMLLAYQQASTFLGEESKDLPALLQSRIYMGLAEAYARLHVSQKAESYLRQANEAFLTSHEEDLLVLSLDYNLSLKILLEGFVRFDLGQLGEQNASRTQKLSQYEQASHVLAQIEHIPPSAFVSDRISAEIVNQRALVAIELGDMEMFKTYLIEGAQRAKELGSEKRRWEVIKNWKTARQQWPHEKRVSDLADLLL